MRAYLNLAVSNLPRTRVFFLALGFKVNEQFCDEATLAFDLSESSGVMFLSQSKFAPFTPHRIANAHEETEILTALQLETREAVDKMASAALSNGGNEIRNPEDHGFMYTRAFADPDGHIWEPFWMNMEAMEART